MFPILFWICLLIAIVLAMVSGREGSPSWSSPASYIFTLVALAIAGYKLFGFG